MFTFWPQAWVVQMGKNWTTFNFAKHNCDETILKDYKTVHFAKPVFAVLAISLALKCAWEGGDIMSLSFHDNNSNFLLI